MLGYLFCSDEFPCWIYDVYCLMMLFVCLIVISGIVVLGRILHDLMLKPCCSFWNLMNMLSKTNVICVECYCLVAVWTSPWMPCCLSIGVWMIVLKCPAIVYDKAWRCMIPTDCCCINLAAAAQTYELPRISHDVGWLLLVCCSWGVCMRDMLVAMAAWSILFESCWLNVEHWCWMYALLLCMVCGCCVWFVLLDVTWCCTNAMLLSDLARSLIYGDKHTCCCCWNPAVSFQKSCFSMLHKHWLLLLIMLHEVFQC